jgi:DNA-binding response OmpR family regulator
LKARAKPASASTGFSRHGVTVIKSTTRSGLIVLAEDDEKLSKLYCDALGARGYTVIATSTGKEALGMLMSNVPKLLILDIMMPEMDGIETCKKARMILGGGVPILFLTALDDVDAVQRCLQAGGDDFLIKSNSIASLIKRVDFWAVNKSRIQTAMARDRAIDRINSMLSSNMQVDNLDNGVLDLEHQLDKGA